jgi:serine/threonine protein kinase
MKEQVSDERPMIGTALASRYRIERPLGEGGMGRVYEAVDQQLGRKVAVKVIRSGVDDPVGRERFLREARSAAALSHPNACQLYEAAEHEGDPFLVMEFLEGEPLSARLARGPLSRDEAVEVILALMDVLDAFHKAGLIHRDLKPSNVFLTPQGAKLLDFGLARHTKRSEAVTSPAITVPGAVTGTLRYMAPEQITGDAVDARTDIFGLGVLLHEMLTGRIPFVAETNADWLNAVLTKEAQPLGDPQLRALEPIVMRALRRKPEERYASVEEMSAELKAALDPDRASAPPEPQPQHNGSLRVVVLPFRLLKDDQEIEALRDGIPEAITALLSGRPGLTLVSNRAAQEFADGTDLITVGRTLNVDRLLSGSILRAGDEARVTVQLIEATDGSVQWSQTTQHTLGSVLALQDDICKQILDGLPLAADSVDGNRTGAGG